MATERGEVVGRQEARALTKQEIDRRIQQLTSHLAGRGDESAGDSVSSDAIHPRWLDPAELVRRMQEFVVFN